MIELRWRVFAGERTLQYRTKRGAQFKEQAGCKAEMQILWGPWKDVPEFAPSARAGVVVARRRRSADAVPG